MSWLSDASANRIIQSYTKNFVDVSGNFKVRNEVTTGGGSGPSSWSAYGQEVSGAQNDQFGWMVDLNEDGTVMAIGKGGGTTNGAYVMRYNSGTEEWDQEIVPCNRGHIVRLNSAGTRLFQARNLTIFSIFDYNSSTKTWSSVVSHSNTEFKSDNRADMSADGNTYAVANGNNVKIYRIAANLTSSLIGSFTMVTSSYGVSDVALSEDGNKIVIGTLKTLINGVSNAGTVSIYEYSGSGSSWSLVGSTINGTVANGQLGWSVAVSSDGNTVAASGWSFTNTVYIYEYTGGVWALKGSPIIGADQPDSSLITHFGMGVELSNDGNTIAIGDYYYNTNQGAAFAFEYTNGDWVKKGDTITAVSSSNYAQLVDLFRSLSISGDGTVIAAGTRHAQANGIYSGSAWAFKSSSSAPSIVIESKEIVDISGGTVSMLNNTMDISSGLVDISGTTWINRGQSGASIADAYQGALVIESAGTSSSDAVLYVETAGQTEAFSIRADGAIYSANTLRHSSDDRRKINEQYITNATATIMKLSPQIYTKLNNFEENQGTPTKIESGLIAQELYYNSPELRHLVNIENRDWYGNKKMPVEYDLSENSVIITDLNQSTIVDLEYRRMMLIMKHSYDENFWKEINKLLPPLDVSVNSIQNSSDLSGNDIQHDLDYTSLGWGNKSATVDYIGLIPYLIKSNKEQQETIDTNTQVLVDNKKALEEDLQTRITELEG